MPADGNIAGYARRRCVIARAVQRLLWDSDPGGVPSVFTAVQEQLGLKLESSRLATNALVIDRLERPTEN